MSRTEVVWRGHPHAPAPVSTIRAARREHGEVTVVDETGRVVPFGPWATVRETLRSAWRAVLELDLYGAAAFLSSRRPPPIRPGRPGNGPTVLVLPVLPDLSHTFVYREALAVLRRRPDWRVIVLRHAPGAPRHGEAEELRRHTVFLPRPNATRRYLSVLAWLMRRRGGSLFSLYRSQPNGRIGDLLGKNPLRDPTHPGNAFALADLLRPLAPRTIHVYGSTYAANVAMGAAILLDVPFSISSYVDFEFPYEHKMLAEKVRRARFFRVVTDACRASLLRRDELRDLPPERLPTIYLGLDLANWQETARPPAEPVFVSAARLVPKKALHLVPDALARLRREGFTCRWHLLGEGPERETIERAVEAHDVADLVTFAGAVDSATVRDELVRATAAVLPCVVADDGERDGIPVFLIEAMALGVPVVTTGISGIPELVRDGETGLLAEPGDPASLATALARVLREPEQTRALGAAGRAEVHATLDVDAKARELIDRIESTLPEV